MVKPGGTGLPSRLIAASPAPLPPRRSFWLPSPSAEPAPNAYTYLVAMSSPPGQHELARSEGSYRKLAGRCHPPGGGAGLWRVFSRRSRNGENPLTTPTWQERGPFLTDCYPQAYRAQ